MSIPPIPATPPPEAGHRAAARMQDHLVPPLTPAPAPPEPPEAARRRVEASTGLDLRR